MSPLLCIYHANCVDGFTAAWAVWRANKGAEFVAASYGDEPPDCTGRDVVIVDFSYKRDALLAMAKTARSILILDHHKSAEAELVDLPPNVHAEFDMNRSGAKMAWQWYHEPRQSSLLVDLVEDRDLWRFKMAHTNELNSYLFSMPFDFESWDLIHNACENESADFDRLVSIGVALERKHDKDVQTLINIGAIEKAFGPYTVPYLNAPPMFASKAGHILCKGKPFAVIYHDSKTHRVFSLRSDVNGLDVSLIAQQCGGGGHKHAAGFKWEFQTHFENAFDLPAK